MRKFAVYVVSAALLAIPVGEGVAQNLGDGMEKARQGDYPAAFDTLHPLAQDGDAQAQFNLGLLYHSGMGVARDEAEAVRLYTASAEKGFPMAQEYLAVGYQEGWFGLPKDAKQADFWQQRLVE